jgi:hypothetical protein
MSDLPVASNNSGREFSRVEVDLSEIEHGVSFAETLGFGRSIRYTPQIHAALNLLMAADFVLTPQILDMSSGTVWLCRLMVGIVLLMRDSSTSLPLRKRLETEAIAGLLLAVLAVRGAVSRNLFERGYLFMRGMSVVANSLMTQVE